MLNFNKKKYVSFDNLKSFNGLLQSSLKEKLDGYKSETDTKVQKKFNELSGKAQTDSEVIDARKGEASLRAKIDVIDENLKNVDSQLEHNTNILSNTFIDITNPLIEGLEGVNGAEDKALENTIRLQAIIDYAIKNKKDIYIPISIHLEPIEQIDGTYTCIKFTDNATSGNYRYNKIKFYGQKGVVLRTSSNVEHSIIRFKLADSTIENLTFEGNKNTTGIELCKMNKLDLTEFDGCSRNNFENLRFFNVKNGITMEGSCYYNKFDNITFMSVDLCLWLKKSYAMDKGLTDVCSGVNRNNFYNMSAYSGKKGILLDYGDTNKFTNCSFEGLNGCAIEVYDQYEKYPKLHHTAYNTFTGITNEANIKDLIHAGYYNNFIDFEGNFTKTEFITPPNTYTVSGDMASNMTKLQSFVSTNDTDVLGFGKNHSFITQSLCVKNISDTIVNSSGVRVPSELSWNIVKEECENIKGLIQNSPIKIKSIGNEVFIHGRIQITVNDIEQVVKIPLPNNYKPNLSVYNYANVEPIGQPVYFKNSEGVKLGIVRILTYGGENGCIELRYFESNWSSSYNIINLNLIYVKE